MEIDKDAIVRSWIKAKPVTSKKVVYTLNINNYSPEINKLTYPFLKKYADKIQADFYVITERKFPDYPIPYEKFQIYNLVQEQKRDWIIYIDSDALVHPDTFDVTEILPQNTVMTCRSMFAPVQFRYDRFFKRDGRNIYAGNWFTVASKLCIDIWRPLDDITKEEAIGNIFPSIVERNSDVVSSHLLDDYVISRNIAKYGLKYTTFIKMLEDNGKPGEFLFHEYLYTEKEKIDNLNKVLDLWRGITT